MKRGAEEEVELAHEEDAGDGVDDVSDGEEEAASGEEPAASSGAKGSASAPGQGKRAKRSQVTLSDGRVVSSHVRNHVNPLLPHFQKPVPVPAGGDWGQVFRDTSLPIVLDIGCAKGRFCLEGAKRFPAFNYIGVEIREPLVVRANMWVKEQGLKNLTYIFGNASAGMADLLTSLPVGKLSRVTIQCPDPWFKKKHQKRRMLTEKLAKELGELVPVGCLIFVQSDVEQVAMQMTDFLSVTGSFGNATSASLEDGALASAAIQAVARPKATVGKDYQDKTVGGGEWEHKGAGADNGSYNWLGANPVGLMSERESSTISRGFPMFRRVLCKLAPNAESAD